LDIAGDVRKNVLSSLSFLEISRQLGISRVVFVSSGGTVYGKPEHVPTPETDPTNPITAYGIGKLAVEKYLALYEHLYQLDYRVLRVTNPYGPFQTTLKNQGIVAALIARALRGETVEIWGDGSVVRDFIYIDDLVDALVAAADDCGDGRVFNIGSGVGRSLLQVIAAIEPLLGMKLNIHWKQARAQDVPISTVAVDRAKALLGWAPKTTFEVGLKETIEWWRAESQDGQQL
jgi:UDP-glucose 4-epimerase